MDMVTAAVVGHSFGGATTIQALSEDSRFKWANTIITMSYFAWHLILLRL